MKTRLTFHHHQPHITHLQNDAIIYIGIGIHFLYDDCALTILLYYRIIVYTYNMDMGFYFFVWEYTFYCYYEQVVMVKSVGN